MSNKVVLITGAGTGFGRATAETLAKKGYTVYATMREPEVRNSKHANALSAQKNIHVLELDVTNQESTDKAVAQIIEEQGRIDILDNNAGNGYFALLESMSIDELQRQMDVNFFGAARMYKAVLPQMRKQQSGLIINISSVVGRIVAPFFGIYNASKFALEALSETYRYELSAQKIDSVLVEPGPFGTSFIEKSLRPKGGVDLSSYGGLVDAPEQVAASFAEMMKGDECNPQIVADDIVSLIETPFGQRPARITSGIDFGVSELNKAVAPFQKGMLEGMEMIGMDPNANQDKQKIA